VYLLLVRCIPLLPPPCCHRIMSLLGKRRRATFALNRPLGLLPPLPIPEATCSAADEPPHVEASEQHHRSKAARLISARMVARSTSPDNESGSCSPSTTRSQSDSDGSDEVPVAALDGVKGKATRSKPTMSSVAAVGPPHPGPNHAVDKVAVEPPKRPYTSYFLFNLENRARLHDANPSLSVTEG
jgi:hypothetical protein